MTVSAYDWFLAVEMARAEGDVRRGRLKQDRESFRRRASEALAQGRPGPKASSHVRSRSEDVTQAMRGFPRSKKPERILARQSLADVPARDDQPARFAARIESISNLAEGHDPVVIKLVSFSRGLRQAAATAASWLHAAAVLETHDSQLLPHRSSLETELRDWAAGFDERSLSQDAVILKASFSTAGEGQDARGLLEAALAIAFAGHRFAVVEPTAGGPGDGSATLILVLGGAQGRLRLDLGPSAWQFTTASQKQVAERLQAAGLPALSFEGLAAPVHGAVALRRLLTSRLETGRLHVEGAVVHSHVEAIALARSWAPELRSHAPRHTLHLLLTARRSSVPQSDAFLKAVRRFLHEAFGDHKFLFAVQDKGTEMLQARALIAMRSENGTKLRPDRAMFDAWRRGFAIAAQDEGLKLVATTAYAMAGGAPRKRRGRAGASAGASETAIIQEPCWAVTERQRQLAEEALAAWRIVAASHPGNDKAAHHIAMLEACLAGGKYLQSLIAMGKAIDSAAPPELGMAQIAAMEAVVAEASSVLAREAGAAFAARAARTLAATRGRLQTLQGLVAPAQ